MIGEPILLVKEKLVILFLTAEYTTRNKKKIYGRNRNRTDDLFLAREARYQLRHVPAKNIYYNLEECYTI